MKSLYKLFLVGLVAFGASCSSDDPSVAGATTEPNTLQQASSSNDSNDVGTNPEPDTPFVAQLTDEQKAILVKAFGSYVDSGSLVWMNDDSGSSPDTSYEEILKLAYPFHTKASESFIHRSKDDRMDCDIAVFPEESGVQVREAFNSSVTYAGSQKIKSGVYASKLIDVDGVPVIVKSVGDARYWGYNVTCSEYLKQFEESCIEANGVFRDFGDGCRESILNLACSMLAPEGMDAETIVASFTEDYQGVCKEDSIRYAAFEDENGAIQACFGYGTVDLSGNSSSYSSCGQVEDSYDSVSARLSQEWRNSLTRTFDAYTAQFNDFTPDTINGGVFGIDSGVSLVMRKFYEELTFKDGLAYNTFPSAEVASSYKEEGIYPLSDSLIGVFFPEIANHVRSGTAYWVIVLKDVGAKGHVLHEISLEEVHVVDILKSGDSCPEDTAVYYSTYLIKGSSEWDVSGKQIVREPYVSPLWNCDNPESMEQIEPYGEWINTNGLI